VRRWGGFSRHVRWGHDLLPRPNTRIVVGTWDYHLATSQRGEGRIAGYGEMSQLPCLNLLLWETSKDESVGGWLRGINGVFMVITRRSALGIREDQIDGFHSTYTRIIHQRQPTARLHGSRHAPTPPTNSREIPPHKFKAGPARKPAKQSCRNGK
jgi:hypothetical protein